MPPPLLRLHVALQLLRPRVALRRGFGGLAPLALPPPLRDGDIALAAAPAAPPLLVVTPRAARRLALLRARAEAEGRADAGRLRLRVRVEGGGCSGFKYEFALEHGALGEGAAPGDGGGASVSDSATAGGGCGSGSEGAVVGGADPIAVGGGAITSSVGAVAVGGGAVTGGGADSDDADSAFFGRGGEDGRAAVPVVVDGASLAMIKGGALDWDESLLRSAFVITGNPQAESSCGCKSSFAIKA